MRTNQPLLLKFLLSIIMVACIATSYAQSVPARKEVLAVMALTNRYFMNKWPDPGKEIVTNRTRPSNIWTRAVYYEGLMAFYKISPQKAFYDYAVQWGESHKWQLRDGLLTRNADNQCCGQTYIDLYLIDPQPQRIKAIKAAVSTLR